VENTLAYYDAATITAVKSFIVQGPGVLSLEGSHKKLAMDKHPSLFFLSVSDE